MSNINIKITRIELIRTKNSIKVARKGLNLLKMKRSSLVMAFLDLARQIEAMKEDMRNSIEKAMNANRMADISLGSIVFDRIAYEQANRTAVVSSKNIMGVKIPNIEMGSAKTTTSEEYLPLYVVDVIHAYNDLLKMLIEVAAKETALKEILYEIEKLNRRSNAIEHVSIPALVYKAKYIQDRLEDMERDQTVSLKFIKGKLDEYKESA